MSKLFKRERINIYSIEPVVTEEPSFDVVLDALENAIGDLTERYGFTYSEAFKLLERKMEEVRDKQELRYRVNRAMNAEFLRVRREMHERDEGSRSM